MTQASLLIFLVCLFLVKGKSAVVEAATCGTPTPIGQVDCDNSCNERGMCLANYQWQTLENCQWSGMVCRAGECVSPTSTEATVGYCNNLYPITCPSGLTVATRFPSLVDCTSYYECVPGEDYASPLQCGGASFDACTGQCSGVLTDGKCSAGSQSAQCTQSGQVGVAADNDRLYFRCLPSSPGSTILQPSWFACGAGQHYSATSGGCVGVVVAGSSACSVCGAVGQKVPGPLPLQGSSCRYVWCKAKDDFEVRSCVAGWHYDHNAGGCVVGACSG